MKTTKTHKQAVEELAACCLITTLGEDVLALEMANKQLEESGMLLQMPGLVRTYEIITNDLARVLRELEQAIDKPG